MPCTRLLGIVEFGVLLIKNIPSADYLAAEINSRVKHEYINGEVYAMAGASDAHVTIALNVAAALKTHLRGSPCRVFISDMKLQVQASNAYFYPDVFVTCDAENHGTVKSDATLVVEVLSPSTAAFDRGAKFAHYRHLCGLQELLLIDPDTQTADLHRKGSDGLWVLHPSTAQCETITFTSIGLHLPMAVVFEDVVPLAAKI